MSASPAVAFGDAVVTVEGRWVRVLDESPESVADAARTLGVDVVYHLGGSAAAGAVPYPDDLPWLFNLDGVRLVIPAGDEDGAAGPWRGVDATTMRHVFARLEGLGIPWRYSVGSTCEALIRSTHPPARGGRQGDRTAEVVPPPARDNIERPYLWSRPAAAWAPAERRAHYAHVFDVNAQHLAAWGVVEVGHGQPVRHQSMTFDKRRAGVWRIEYAPACADAMLPPVWESSGQDRGYADPETWVTTPTLARLLEVCEGYDAPRVLESWVWPEKSRYLRGAAERIRDARAAALRAAETAQEALKGGDVSALDSSIVSDVVADAVKALYQRQTGRFGAEWMPVESGMARPDWRAFVIGQARVNLHRKIEAMSVRPVAVLTDALLFLSDEPDPVAFARRARISVGLELGQFNHEGSGDGQAVRDVLTSSDRRLWRAFQAGKGLMK